MPPVGELTTPVDAAKKVGASETNPAGAGNSTEGKGQGGKVRQVKDAIVARLAFFRDKGGGNQAARGETPSRSVLAEISSGAVLPAPPGEPGADARPPGNFDVTAPFPTPADKATWPKAWTRRQAEPDATGTAPGGTAAETHTAAPSGPEAIATTEPKAETQNKTLRLGKKLYTEAQRIRKKALKPYREKVVDPYINRLDDKVTRQEGERDTMRATPRYREIVTNLINDKGIDRTKMSPREATRIRREAGKLYGQEAQAAAKQNETDLRILDRSLNQAILESETFTTTFDTLAGQNVPLPEANRRAYEAAKKVVEPEFRGGVQYHADLKKAAEAPAPEAKAPEKDFPEAFRKDKNYQELIKEVIGEKMDDGTYNFDSINGHMDEFRAEAQTRYLRDIDRLQTILKDRAEDTDKMTDEYLRLVAEEGKDHKEAFELALKVATAELAAKEKKDFMDKLSQPAPEATAASGEAPVDFAEIAKTMDATKRADIQKSDDFINNFLPGELKGVEPKDMGKALEIAVGKYKDRADKQETRLKQRAKDSPVYNQVRAEMISKGGVPDASDENALHNFETNAVDETARRLAEAERKAIAARPRAAAEAAPAPTTGTRTEAPATPPAGAEARPVMDEIEVQSRATQILAEAKIGNQATVDFLKSNAGKPFLEAIAANPDAVNDLLALIPKAKETFDNLQDVLSNGGFDPSEMPSIAQAAAEAIIARYVREQTGKGEGGPASEKRGMMLAILQALLVGLVQVGVYSVKTGVDLGSGARR